MATTDLSGLPMDASLGTAVIAIGLLAAFGSILVALGLTDVLAIVDGYRPAHSLTFGYGQALVVTTAGWALLAVAAVHTVRTARRV